MGVLVRLGLSLLLGVGATTAACAKGAVLVVNSAAASLSVVDMDTHRELRRIPVLREPHHLMLTPDRTELLVGDTAGNEMLFLDPATFEVRRRMTVADPYQLGFSPDGQPPGRDRPGPRAGRRLRRGHHGAGASLPAGNRCRATWTSRPTAPPSTSASRAPGSLPRSTSAAWPCCGRRRSERLPAGVMWQNGQVLVANMGEDNVAVVDPVDGRMSCGACAPGKWRAPALPFARWNRLIYVNNRVEGSTVALDAASLAVRARATACRAGPDDIVFAPDGTPLDHRAVRREGRGARSRRAGP